MKSALKKLGLGLTVLLGVVSLVFLIFSMGSDPVENLVSENTTEEVRAQIRRKYNLDLSAGKRYLIFLNDLSPLSIHNPRDEASRIYWSEDYQGAELFSLGDRSLFLKTPYLGRSFVSDRSVTAILAEAIPGTALLAITAITIALLLGLFIGTIAAQRKGSMFDRLALVLSALGMSGPSFFMAMIIAWIGGWLWFETTSLPILPIVLPLLLVSAAWIGRKHFRRELSMALALMWGLVLGVGIWVLASAFNLPNGGYLNLPGTGLSMSGSWKAVDVWDGPYIAWSHLILPAITLGIRPLAVVVQLMRNSLLEVMSQDYIRTARAKGLKESQVVWKHGFRNALNPVVTAASGWFASMLAGAVFVEYVFGWRGLGMATYQALETNDMPVVMGAVILIAAIFVVINLLVDMVYAWIDPRVRSKA